MLATAEGGAIAHSPRAFLFKQQKWVMKTKTLALHTHWIIYRYRCK